MSRSSSSVTHDSSLYETTTTSASTDSTVRRSATGISRLRLNGLFVLSSRASMRLHATP